MKMMIRLDTIEKVKNFVNTVFHYSGDADLRSGRYTVDAKSIMGIFSLDLDKPVELELYGPPEPALMEELGRYRA